MVILSEPAAASVSSSLANALAEYGQVGSRNISNRRGPWPQVSGSACLVLIVSVMPSSSLLGVESRQPSVTQSISCSATQHMGHAIGGKRHRLADCPICTGGREALEVAISPIDVAAAPAPTPGVLS